jgi:hypothetical protein
MDPTELDDLAVMVDDPEDDEYGMGKGQDKRCGAVWFGYRLEHCTQCHQTFSGSSTGDVHRTGPHPQRCRAADELTSLGLWVERNHYGTDVWHGSPNKKGIQKRHPKRKDS